MRVGTFPAPWGVQTSTERSEVGANTPLLRSRRQTPLWRLSACTGEVYCFASGLHNLLCLFKNLRLNNTQIWTFHDHPLSFIFVCPLPGQKVGYFLFTVDDFAGVKLIRKNTANPILAPLAIPFKKMEIFAAPYPSLIYHW